MKNVVVSFVIIAAALLGSGTMIALAPERPSFAEVCGEPPAAFETKPAFEKQPEPSRGAPICGVE